jgi:sec-independent protein translocase protein TatA
MGLGGISLWQLLIVLLIVIVIFGTKRLSSIGSDLGGAVKGFRKAMGDSEKAEDAAQIDQPDAEFSESKADTSDSVSESETGTRNP